MSGSEEMSKALNATTPGFPDIPSTIVRATIVQASTVYNDTPKTIGNSPFLLLFFFLRVSVKIVSNGLLEFAEKAEKLIAEAASNGSELVVFPEGFIGGYPRGFRFGIAVGIHNEDGRDDFRKYHDSAIHVPGNINFLHMDYTFFFVKKKNHKRPSFKKINNLIHL